MQYVLQNVFCVPCGCHSEDFELGILRFDLSAQVLEHLNCVLNRIAIRKLVSLTKNVALFVEQYRLGRSRSAIDSDKSPNRCSTLESSRNEFLATIQVFERIQFVRVCDESLGAGLGFFFLTSKLDVVNQLVITAIASHAIFFALAELNRAHGGKVLRILRNFNEIFGLGAIWYGNLALGPHTWNVCLPGFAHAADKA